jgi:hypothetical protein
MPKVIKARAMEPIKTRHDGVGTWFAGFADVGESCAIRAGIKRASEPRVAWFEGIPHSRYDGIGALVHLLRQNGYPGLKEIPSLTHLQRPSLLARLWMGLRHVFRMARARNACNLPRLPGASREHPPLSRLFTAEETERLLVAARSQAVTVNTLLLRALAESTRDALGEPETTLLWMIPVNMRGGVAMPEDTMNHASFVDIAVRPAVEPAVLQREIRAKLEQGWHWWYWHFFQLTSRLGPFLRRMFLELQAKMNYPWIGSFSNLGRWDLPLAPGIEGWFFAPPVTSYQPIGAGCLTCYGRLALSLQIHSSIDPEQRLAGRIIEGWAARLTP